MSLDGDPIPVPAVVTLRVPEGALSQISETAQVIAAVPASALERLSDGPQRVQATLRVPGALAGVAQVQIMPETVMVNLRVRRQSETCSLPSVPVWFSLPPTEDAGAQAGWSIELVDKFLSDVTFTGPAEEIRRIRSGELPVKATIELSSEDLQRGVTSARATFPALPATIRVSVQNPEVRVKVVRGARKP